MECETEDSLPSLDSPPRRKLLSLSLIHFSISGAVSCRRYLLTGCPQVQDSFPFSIGFSSDAGLICLGINNVLIPKGQHIPSTKILSFQRNSLFHLEAVYSNPDELPPGMSSKIGCFTIFPFQGSNNSNSRVKVRVQLNMNGITTVESATIIEDTIDQQIPRRDATHSNTEKMETEFVDSSHSESNVSRKARGTRRIDIPVI
ncbi:hypothetical protein IC575_030444 [Cucumis melo]|uniref:Heat shock 70 kDa protein 16-like isoform X1 n=1 Tax=Cucumis melo TaxID=3656 RepID=A0ABM3KT15_CUCME|nr:heat shock 70 kDa protein 16-like isoform X1 [Cucumis melo]XP_050940920.1 heat shock 70 kDa protein 16-like isoform X1 [Cucumis melo]XP_050940925.1 heat shock 70 kDa protein 16-like isoform X1 [Cucumis melo]XP_050940926.1 heat shock 70 kDa protein 16-like isoform X1 [Cucumis melo]XP_050941237.1 heat shock 70 kDa protein 16-like isoform X1 [Cucumis melo]